MNKLTKFRSEKSAYCIRRNMAHPHLVRVEIRSLEPMIFSVRFVRVHRAATLLRALRRNVDFWCVTNPRD